MHEAGHRRSEQRAEDEAEEEASEGEHLHGGAEAQPVDPRQRHDDEQRPVDPVHRRRYFPTSATTDTHPGRRRPGRRRRRVIPGPRTRGGQRWPRSSSCSPRSWARATSSPGTTSRTTTPTTRRSRPRPASLAVVRPGCTAEVAAVLKMADELHVPVTARGSGTGLSGGGHLARGGDPGLVRADERDRRDRPRQPRGRGPARGDVAALDAALAAQGSFTRCSPES